MVVSIRALTLSSQSTVALGLQLVGAAERRFCNNAGRHGARRGIDMGYNSLFSGWS